MTATELAVVKGDVVRAATREEAEARRTSIRRTLELAVDQLVTAWQARDYEALGYGRGQAGWEAYLEDSYGDLRHLRLPVEARRDRLVLMHGARMSVRAIAATPGMAGRQQTANDLAELREAGRIVDAGTVVGIDGKRQRRTPRPTPAPAELELELELEQAPPAPTLEGDAAVLAAVEALGDANRYEVAEALGWRDGRASAALSRLHRIKGRLELAGYPRDGVTVYRLPRPALEQ